jgi:hypothetical protein
VDALITDRYLESLLIAHARGADHGPVGVQPPADIRRAVDRLARELPRFHPSFRFEEALAVRLAEAAARMRLTAAAGAEGRTLALPGGPPDPELDELAALAGAVEGRPGIGRPLLIGGALTSAALSIAGAAYVAWRFNRPPTNAMVRAARAVARARPVPDRWGPA